MAEKKGGDEQVFPNVFNVLKREKRDKCFTSRAGRGKMLITKQWDGQGDPQ